MLSGKGQPSPAPSKRLNVSRTVEAAMPSRRAISRVEIPAENFKRMISRTWRIATLSAGIIAPLDCQRSDPKQASGGARRHSRPRAALFRSGGRHHLVMVGGIIPLRRATSSRYDGRLGQESAPATCGVGIFAIPPLYVMFQAIRERVGPGSRPNAEQTATERQDKPGSAEREHVAAE